MQAQSIHELRNKYREACKECWNPREAVRRFAEYDRYRPQFVAALRKWIQEERPTSLTKCVWHCCWEFNEGKYLNCLDFSERRQKIYLGDGLIEYVKLLLEEIERVYAHAAL